MLKLVSWDLRDHVEILNGPSATFEKNAAAFEGEYPQDIIEVIEKLEKKPNHTYLLINALGAGEYYGQNKNGDYFPERALQEYHKTFEALAHVYKHHVNKDPRRSYGKVLYSFYNNKMHRVELIVEVSNEKARDIIERLESGKSVTTSMGCKVPFDVCNICGNRAKTRAQYCKHLRRGSIGQIQPDGKKAYAINTRPKFFDISFVTIPADPTSGVMAKVAHDQHLITSSEEDMDSLLKQSGLKHADIVKRIEGKVEASSSDPAGLIPGSQKDAPVEEIKALTAKYGLSEILSTLLAMQVMPKKRDFQRLVFYSMNKPELAECPYEFPVDESVDPIMPADVDPLYMNSQMARGISHWIPERSLTKPLIVIRVMKKYAEEAAQAQQQSNHAPHALSMRKQLLIERMIKDREQRLTDTTNKSWTKQAEVGSVSGGGASPGAIGPGGISGPGSSQNSAFTSTQFGSRAATARFLSKLSPAEKRKWLEEMLMQKQGSIEKRADPDPATYSKMSNIDIVNDLESKHGYGKDDTQPWMMKNNLWDDRDGPAAYITKGWVMPYANYTEFTGSTDPYAKAKHVYGKGYTNADDWYDNIGIPYGLGQLSPEEQKNLDFIANPPAQNKYVNAGIKGYKALKQSRTMSKTPAALADQKSNKSPGTPTKMEEQGKILPSTAREKSASVADMTSKQEEMGGTIMPSPDMNEKSPYQNPFFAITGLGALYLGYQRLMDLGKSRDLPKLEKTMIRNPWMLPLLAGAVGGGAMLLQKNAEYVHTPRRYTMSGMKSILAATVPSYLYAGHQEAKVRRGEQIDNFQNFVRKHPFLTSVGALVTLRGGLKAFNKYASVEDVVNQMDNDQINDIYEKIIAFKP